MQYLQLKKDIEFVHGAKNSALYNLENGDIYSVEQELAMILKLALLVTYEDIYQKYPAAIKPLNELISMGLIELVEKRTENNSSAAPKKFPALDFVWLELLESCNLRCVHCYGNFGRKHGKSMMQKEDWKRCLQQSRELGCRAVQFIGGEPFMYPHLMELIGYARILQYELIEIFTNATLITEKHIEILKQNNVSVAISVYSSKTETHDLITNIRGSFLKTMAAIKILKKAGVKTRYATVLMKQNQDELQETMKFLSSLGEVIPLKSCDVIRPVGRGGDNRNVPDKFIPWLYRANAVFPKIYKKDFLRNKSGHPCWQDRICIKSSGAVIPCIMARNNEIGNVLDCSLLELADSSFSKKLSGLSKDNIDVCKDCEFRYACVDCRPHAESITGDIKAKPPTCLYDPYLGIWAKPTY